MDRLLVLKAILAELARVAHLAQQAADQARETATHTENVAENKYDTLGLEAAYLAHGQSLRVLECRLDIAAFEALTGHPLTLDPQISVGASVCLADSQGARRWLFLGPRAGGLKLNIDDQEIVVITPAAPLGKALLGRRVNDEFWLTINGQRHYHEIVAVC